MSEQDWIKTALKSKGCKLKDVAEALGITSPRVTDIIKGAREVQSDELLPLAEMLGLSVKSLLVSLREGRRTLAPSDNADSSLPILGKLFGDGTLVPLSAESPIHQVAIPPDAQNTEGLYCYIMGDNSMAGEIKAGDILIAADPRIHFYPMVPGGVFLVTGPNDTLAARQFLKTDTGESWLVPIPPQPNPAFQSWRFDMLLTELTGLKAPPSGVSEASPEKDNGIVGHRTVHTEDIFAAVLWVHRRYMPVSTE